MGATQSTPKKQQETQAAGCFFTDGIHVLGGLQKKKGKWIISGFGGMCKKDEIIPLTAFRECLEELLGLFDLSPSLLHDLYLKHRPSKILVQSSYTNYVYSFTQLESILQMVYTSGITSCPLYTNFPLTVQDLLFKRLCTSMEPESTTSTSGRPVERLARHMEPESTTSTSGRPVERLARPTEVTVLTLLPAHPCSLAEEFQDDIQKAKKT